jgi:hypothetical protein
MRKGRKAKELVNPSLGMSKALDQAVDALDRDRTGRVTFNEFQEFVNSSDLEEAMALITGVTGPRDVAAAVDASKLVRSFYCFVKHFSLFVPKLVLLCSFFFPSDFDF